MKKYNFYAGPAILPQEVIRQAGQAVENFADMGLSILEVSHRSKQFDAVMQEAEALAAELLGLPENFAVLFLSGGASSQFFMAPLNLLPQDKKAGYIDTGSWSSKAIKEAKRYGTLDVIASSKTDNYNHIPKNYVIPEDLEYLHITTNNTIYGTEYHNLPQTDIPLIGDMSSNIFSRTFDPKRFQLIYAGAQKNMGPAGVTLVLVNKDALGKTGRDIPSMLDYQVHVSKHSNYNTSPVFPIYVSMLTMRWIKENGGVSGMELRNRIKAEKLYAEIDRNPMFYGTAAKEDRSAMNVCFLQHNEALEKDFLNICNDAGCVGVQGHRSVGGFRASIYNAMELEGVEALISVMQEFEAKFG